MKTFFKFQILVLANIFISLQVSQATNFTWTGSVDSTFTNANNWNPSNVGYPDVTDTIEIVTATNRLVLDDDYEVGVLIMTSGNLDLNGYSLSTTEGYFSSGNIGHGLLAVRGLAALFEGTEINSRLEVVAEYILLNGGVFNDSCFFELVGDQNSEGEGGCVFNSGVVLVHSGTDDAEWHLAMNAGDEFNGDVSITVQGNGGISIAEYGDNYFNGNIELNNTGDYVIIFGYGGGSSTLANGKTISIGSEGYSVNNLYLVNFHQIGNTVQNLTLDGTAKLILHTCSFEGDIDISAPEILCRQSEFYGECNISKTAETTNIWYGGNKFHGITHINFEDGNGALSYQESSEYANDVYFDSSNDSLYVAYGKGSSFKGNVSLLSDFVSPEGGPVKFCGSTDQYLSGTTYFIFQTLIMDNEGGSLIPDQPILIIDTLNLKNGYIISTFDMHSLGNIVLMGPSSVALNASDQSFVEGLLAKIGDTAFEFPIGKRGKIRTVSIPSTNNSELYFAEFYDQDPESLGSVVQSDTIVQSISNCSYWIFSGGSTAITASFAYDMYSCDYMNDSIINIAQLDLRGEEWSYFGLGSSDRGLLTIDSANELGIFAIANPSYDRIYTWTGDSSSEWKNSSNWLPSIGYPGETDIAIIPHTNNNDLILDDNYTVLSLTINDAMVNLNEKKLVSNQHTNLNKAVVMNGILSAEGESAKINSSEISCDFFISARKINMVENRISGFANIYLYNDEIIDPYDLNLYSYTITQNQFESHVVIENKSTSFGTHINLDKSVFAEPLTISNDNAGLLLISCEDNTILHDTLFFNNNSQSMIILGYDEYLKEASGSFILENNASIQTGDDGITSGGVGLININQTGNVTNNLLLTNDAILAFANCKFSGEVAFTAPGIMLWNNALNNNVELNCTSDVTSMCDGGNVFNKSLTINNNGTGEFYMAYSIDDEYKGAVDLNSEFGSIYMGYDGSTMFHNDLSVTQGNVHFGGGIGKSIFKGNTIQNLNGSTPVTIRDMVMDKPSKWLKLNTPLNISNTLEFVSGKITSDTVNIISFESGAESINSNRESFVSGPVKRYGGAEFIFPIGKTGEFRPIGISASNEMNDSFIAEYFNQGQALSDSIADSTIQYISDCSYWRFNNESGNSAINISFAYDEESCDFVSDATVILANNYEGVWISSDEINITQENILLDSTQRRGYFAIAYSVKPELFTWTGDSSSTWSESSNWQPNHRTPGSLDSILILGGTPFSLILDEDMTVNYAIIDSASLDLNGSNFKVNRAIAINKSIIDNGVLMPKGIAIEAVNSVISSEIQSSCRNVRFLNDSISGDGYFFFSESTLMSLPYQFLFCEEDTNAMLLVNSIFENEVLMENNFDSEEISMNMGGSSFNGRLKIKNSVKTPLLIEGFHNSYINELILDQSKK